MCPVQERSLHRLPQRSAEEYYASIKATKQVPVLREVESRCFFLDIMQSIT